MTKLFGLPVGIASLAVLVALLGARRSAPIAVLAVRNRVLFRLGVRNARRRPARTALIVAGSMLGTTIIAAALATGDTMSHTIRASAVAALGRADEVVAARGVEAALARRARAPPAPATSRRRTPPASPGAARLRPRRRRRARDRRADRGAGRHEPPERAARHALRERRRQRCAAFGTMRSGGSATVSLADLRPGEVFLNAEAASNLDARAGDSLRVFAGGWTRPSRARDRRATTAAAPPTRGC